MRKFYYTLNLLALMLFFVFYYYHNKELNTGQLMLNAHKTGYGAISSLGDNRTFILSPYYEPRGHTPSVRVLAIIHHSVTELYCWFHCVHGSPVSVQAQIYLHRQWFGFSYGTANLLCAEPPDCLYRYISVHWSKHQNITPLPRFEVRNRPPPAAPSVNFTVCISTMYGDYNNVLQTIQSLEMYKLLGAGRVTLYLNQCHQNLEKVLRYYVEEGILELIPWPIHKFLRISKMWRYHLSNDSQVHYFAQSATLNDCLYRNMYRSKFVFLNDIDEIILPVKYNDWPSLMDSLKKQSPEASVFFFENHVFPAVANNSERTTWGDVPGVDILPNIFKKRVFDKNRKYLVDPRKIYQASIHRVLKRDGEHKYVKRHLAFGFHCKSRQAAGNNSLITDRTLWRYNVSLTQNVNKVIQRVFLHR